MLQNTIRKEYTMSVTSADLKPDVSFHWLLALFLEPLFLFIDFFDLSLEMFQADQPKKFRIVDLISNF